MRVKILKRSFAGAEFAPDVRVLKVGGQSSAGVEKLEFELPAEWQGLSVTLHVQWLDGTLPAPVLLDDEDSVAVDKTLTASPGGQWMLLALGADGYRALTKPTKYECYSTLNTDGDVEISPTQYETFVARVLEYSNTAQQAAASAKTNAETAATAATRAVNAKGQAETAARTATAGAENSENSAARAEAAAARAEAAAPETGKVVSVNGKGGAVHLTAEDVGAMPASGAAVVQSIRLEGRTLTVAMADGTEKSFTTQDTTSLTAMTGVLETAHGGTGKETPLTAEDVGAVEAGSSVYIKALTVQGNTMTVTKGDGSTETVMLAQEYVLPAATASRLGGVKVGDYLDIDADGNLSGKTLRNTIAASMAVEAKEILAWNTYAVSATKFTEWDIQIPDNVDKICITKSTCGSDSGTAIELARGGNTTYSVNYDFTVTFRENGTLHVVPPYKTSYALNLWIDGYHYPTFDELLASKNATGSDARLVWNTSAQANSNWQTFDIKVPDNVDYVRFKAGSDSTEVDLARGGTTYYTIPQSSSSRYSNTTFQTNGTLHFALTVKSSYATQIWVTGYHYPTLAELLAETQTAQADTDALAVDQEYRVAMLELGLTDDTTTDTSTT